MPKYIPVADKIADGLFAAKNRLFDLVQRKIDEGKSEKEVMKEIKEGHTADPAVLSEIEHTFFKKKDKSASLAPALSIKSVKFNPYRTKKATDLIELRKDVAELDAIMDAATDMHSDGLLSDEEYASVRKVYDAFDDPAYLTQATKDLAEALTKVLPDGKDATWIDDAKVGDQVELNNETGEVTYIGSDKVEVKTPTKTETIWKN